MRPLSIWFIAAGLLAAQASVALAGNAPLKPEIERPIASAQPVGQEHTLRNIPEACVRLQGQFTGDAAKPYAFEAVPRDRCAQRAMFVDAAKLKQAPSVKSGWILNDRISVPRADSENCVATVEVWRREGSATPPKLDAQGRTRLYLDKPQGGGDAPMFTAMLAIDARSCR